MTEPLVIGFGVNKWIKDSDTRLINLYGHTYGTSAPSSLNEINSAGTTSTAYQVPTGKKLIILAMFVNTKQAYNSFGSQTYYSSSTSGGSGHTIGDFYWNQPSSASGMIECYIELPAGRYISVTTYKTSPGRIIGIETNA